MIFQSPVRPGDPITREGAIYQRALGDGREVCVMPKIFTTAVTIGRADDAWGYTTHYCYETPIQAAIAAAEWDPATKPEPSGWFRHPQTGRRRPGGDPSKEYINP
jgi:hypothetical protein